MLLIVHQCFLMMLSRKIIVRKATLQTTNRVFFSNFPLDVNGRNVMFYTYFGSPNEYSLLSGLLVCKLKSYLVIIVESFVYF